MHDKVDGGPVVDGVRGFQQHEAHAHVVVGPHLQEPVDPVEDVLTRRTQLSADRGLHGRLGSDAQGDGEEGEVVADMQSVPVGADEHGPAGPESYRRDDTTSTLLPRVHASLQLTASCCLNTHWWTKSKKAATELFVLIISMLMVKTKEPSSLF